MEIKKYAFHFTKREFNVGIRIGILNPYILMYNACCQAFTNQREYLPNGIHLTIETAKNILHV